MLTVAIADALLDSGSADYLDRHDLYIDKLHDWFCLYPEAGYGDSFYWWAEYRKRRPYGSWGNGSAMRVSPIGYAFQTMDQVLAEAKLSAEVTHDHPEGMKGAQAVATAVFLARQGASKGEIKRFVEEQFAYNLNRTLDEIRPNYAFDVSCQGSVPESIIAFLESNSFEEVIRLAISLGGDSDTMACIAGSIAEPFYGGVPEGIAKEAMSYLDEPLREVVTQYQLRFST